MYSTRVFSFKNLLLLTVLFPGVLLQFYDQNYVDYIVSECERESSELEANEKANGWDDGEYLQSSLTLEDHKTEQIQRRFECISNKIQGPIVELSPEYQNLKQQCELEQGFVACDSSYPYRTIDGTCNNLLNPRWGSVQSCANRFLPPYYEGVSDFRRSVCGISLPNARILSLNVFERNDKLSEDRTIMFAFFAQLVTHDIANTPNSTRNNAVNCCSRRFRGHPQCAPIDAPPNDPTFSRVPDACIDMSRAIPCRTCSIGKRNTIVEQTSFIDASFLYGLTEEEARSLRRNDGTGKMKVQHTAAGDLLPPQYQAKFKCSTSESTEHCFKSSDGRVNQHTALASLHTVFLREHNRIAGILSELNLQWDDEKIYQETRRIIGAMFQNIAYNEFLPPLIGSELMKSFNLAPSEGWSFYNPLVNPTIHAEFTIGAFRLHGLVPTVYTEYGVDGGKRNLSEFTVHSAEPIYHGDMDNLLEGICLTPSGTLSKYYSPEITETLFRKRGYPGIDLAAVDIQRGRDAGMPPYTEVLRYLSDGKTNIQTFSDLAKLFKPEDVQELQSLYCDPRDIDYFVGVHYEPIVEDGLLWHSAAEIVARQFKNLKFGDRFYFEHFGNFNLNQLRTIKDVKLSTLLCENTNIEAMQELAMEFPNARNPIKPCGAIPKLNLEFWKVF